MKTIKKIIITISICVSLSSPEGILYAHSIRHHTINMGKDLAEVVTAPLYGTFIQGPKNIKKAYEYEVHQREKPEKRGLLRYKLLAIWRAPGEEMKGIIDGVVDSIEASGNFLKEFISIFWSD
jgi:hypothetical protein